MCWMGFRTLVIMYRLGNDNELHTTTNHIYNPKDCIGQGASCRVYKGHSKGTWEIRALKVITNSDEKAHEGLARELDAFISIKHKNIVKFYDLDTDMTGSLFHGLETPRQSIHQSNVWSFLELNGWVHSDSKGDCSNRPVLVMEYVGGGSLQTFLLEPENMRGIGECEFLILLEHLACGLLQLNRKGFLHRDIKPANILRAKAEDGSALYKLSDFGSSRQLDQDSGFQSLAGTEEYLHPAIYHKAFFNRQDTTVFGAYVDMWSLGITLYHAITGNIPFQPYGGSRANRIEMYKMISQKPKGAISGTQTAPGNKITWRKDFPSNCNMSMGLQTHVLPLIKGLVDNNPTTQWTFDTFNKETQNIISLIAINVFSTCSAEFLTLYLKPTARYAALFDSISLQTQEPSENHLLMYENKILKDMVSADAEIKDYPDISQHKPIIVISKVDCDDMISKEPSLEAMPHWNESGEKTRQQEFKFQRSVMSLMYEIASRIENVILSQHLLYVAEDNSRMWLISDTCSLEEKIEKLFELSNEKRSTLELLTSLTKMYNMRKNNNIQKAEKAVTKLHKGTESLKILVKQMRKALKSSSHYQKSIICDIDKCGQKTKHICLLSKEIWTDVLKRLQEVDSSFVEERRIVADRQRLEKYGEELENRYKNHCKPQKQRALTFYTQERRLLNQKSVTIEDAERKMTSLHMVFNSLTQSIVQIRAMTLKGISSHFEKSLSLVDNCEKISTRVDADSTRKIKENLEKESRNLHILIRNVTEIYVPTFDDASEDRCRSPRISSGLTNAFSYGSGIDYSTRDNHPMKGKYSKMFNKSKSGPSEAERATTGHSNQVSSPTHIQEVWVKRSHLIENSSPAESPKSSETKVYTQV